MSKGVYKHYKHTEETGRKISKALTGKPKSEEHKRNIGKSLKGIPLTEEHCKNIGLALTGRIFSEEHCKNISLGRIGKFSGDKHPQWQGGISEQGYPFNFNEELKESIRKRDNYTCQLCGKTKEVIGKKLNVHHIDYIKENLDPNNLLTLCRSCNSKVNFNRESWIEFFGLKLNMSNQESVN